MSVAPDPVGSDVFARLGLKFRELARQEHVNNGSGAERCTVLAVAPLTLEAFESDLILTEGDPDFTIGAGLRDQITGGHVDVTDEVWVLREGQRWHAVDLAVADS